MFSTLQFDADSFSIVADAENVKNNRILIKCIVKYILKCQGKCVLKFFLFSKKCNYTSPISNIGQTKSKALLFLSMKDRGNTNQIDINEHTYLPQISSRPEAFSLYMTNSSHRGKKLKITQSFLSSSCFT